MRRREFRPFAVVLVVLTAFALAVAPAAAASVVDESIIPGDVGVAFVSSTPTTGPVFMTDPFLSAEWSGWPVVYGRLSGLAVEDAFTVTPTHRVTGADDAYQLTRAVTPSFLGVSFTGFMSTLTTTIQRIASGVLFPSHSTTITNSDGDGRTAMVSTGTTGVSEAEGVAHRALLVRCWCSG